MSLIPVYRSRDPACTRDPLSLKRDDSTRTVTPPTSAPHTAALPLHALPTRSCCPRATRRSSRPCLKRSARARSAHACSRALGSRSFHIHMHAGLKLAGPRSSEHACRAHSTLARPFESQGDLHEEDEGQRTRAVRAVETMTEATAKDTAAYSTATAVATTVAARSQPQKLSLRCEAQGAGSCAQGYAGPACAQAQ